MHRQQPNLLIEIGNAVTHGLGVGLSIVGMIALIITAVNAHSPLKLVAFIIYGTVLVLFYLASTLFHSLIFTRARHVFQVFDHSMIYLLIAGSYTPYCLVAIRGWLGISLLTVIWLMAIGGVIYKALWLNKKSFWSTVIYVIMGWMCLFARSEERRVGKECRSRWSPSGRLALAYFWLVGLPSRWAQFCTAFPPNTPT